MRTAAIVENATHQTAFCECGGSLDFTVTTGGYVLEECTRCHRSGEMRPAVPRVELALSPLIAGPKCMDCGVGLPKWVQRCPDCRNVHNNKRARTWQLAHRKPAEDLKLPMCDPAFDALTPVT